MTLRDFINDNKGSNIDAMSTNGNIYLSAEQTQNNEIALNDKFLNTPISPGGYCKDTNTHFILIGDMAFAE